MSIVRPEYYTLYELLRLKFFEIPNYQRTYSWTKKQRDDLFNDIDRVHKWKQKDRHHFMATIVCLNGPGESKKIGTDKYAKFYIVDGQQRLTTLITLLKALSKALKNGTTEEKEEYKSIEDLLVKKDKRLILLQTNHDNLNIFFNYLTEGNVPKRNTANTFTDRNLIDAIIDCEAFVKRWKYEHGLLKLLEIIKNRLGFVFYVLKDSCSVYSVFEVLNSRGLAVDWLDKTKSMLMGCVHDKFSKSAANKHHIPHLHGKWTKLYGIIGLTDIPGHEIIRFTATLMNEDSGNKPMSPEDSLEYFASLCNKDRDNVFKIVEEISKITTTLKEIYLNRRQKAVTDISQARLLAAAIKLSKNLSDNEKVNLLDQWERVTFRIFGINRKDSRTAVGDYVRIAKLIYNGKVNYSKAMEELINLGSEYPVKEFLNLLSDQNCYKKWAEELRYFFFRYEEHLSRQNKAVIKQEIWESIWNESPINSIEHIYPQDPYSNWKYWKNKLGRSKNSIEKNKHRLGNLVLLPPAVNSSCGAKPFEKKKEIYKSQKLFLIDGIVKKRDWDLKAVTQREHRLIKWAKLTWCDLEK